MRKEIEKIVKEKIAYFARLSNDHYDDIDVKEGVESLTNQILKAFKLPEKDKLDLELHNLEVKGHNITVLLNQVRNDTIDETARINGLK